MRSNSKPLSELLIISLLVGPLLPTFSGLSFADEPSAATSVLQGMTGALNGTNTLLSTIQSSNAQMQSMFGQFTNLNGQQAAVTQGLGALEQTKQELSTALATAQMCVGNAETKKNSKMGRYKNAKITSATSFTSAEATCENYGALADSGRRLADQLTSAMEKTACMTQLQNTLGQVANKSKTAFTQAQAAATEVYNTRTSIITSYETIGKKIDGDLNGENGYKAKLSNLKKLSADLYQKVNAGLSVKDNKAEGGGFAARLRMARANRTQAANTWYKTLMGEAQQCFRSSPLECRSGTATSPLNCIAEAVGSPSGTGSAPTNTSSVAQRAMGAANVDALRRTLGLNASVEADSTRLANLDVKNEAEFLNYTSSQFDKMVAKTIGNFKGQTFYGNKVNKSDLGNFIKAKYTECYNTAVANYKADMSSDGPQYKAALRSVEEQEAGLNAEIKGIADDANNTMNEFRTAFTKVYNADLPQFQSDCTASDDPYQSLDCLRMLSANLKSGIEGTTQTVKLDTKLSSTGLKQFTAAPPATAMNLQNLTIDPTTGKPTLGSTSTTCVGFNECVNVLDRQLTSVNDQKAAQETQRKDFVDTHNKSINTSLGAVAAQFTAVGTLFGAEVEKLNKELTGAGVSVTLKTKQVEGEALVANEKTGLYDTPKDMKAAIASQGAFTELDEPGETQKSIQEQAKEIAKKVNEAYKKKDQCIIKKGDYDSIANSMDCSEANVCKGDRIGRLLTPLQALLHKSSKNPDASEKATVSNDYNSCIRSARTAEDPSSAADREDLKETGGDDTERKERKEKRQSLSAARTSYRAGEGQACAVTALGQLDAKVEDSVNDTTKSTNSGIMGKVRAVIDACPDTSKLEKDETPDYSEAVSACNSAKSSIKGLTPPPALDTKLDDSGSSAPTFSDPLGGVKSAK